MGVVAGWSGVCGEQLASLLAYLTAAAAFYFCARPAALRWEWRPLERCCFAFSFFDLFRRLPHLWLTFTGTVPLALFTCAIVAAGRRTAIRPSWRWLCYGTAVLLGATNPYNLYLYLQLLAWALLAAWLRSRWSPNVRLGLGCMAVAVCVFAAIHARNEIAVVVREPPTLLVP